MSEPTREQLATQVRYLEAEVTDLRRRLDDVPGQARGLESRLADAQRSLAGCRGRGPDRVRRRAGGAGR